MFSMEYRGQLFGNWLLKELERRGWSQSLLATKAGLSRGTISNIMNGTRGVGEETLNGIARALQLPPETVFRAAGLLPPEPEYVPLLDEWTAVFYELTADEQQEMIDIARLKVDRRKSPGQQPNQKSPSRSKRPARNIIE